jgi:glycosyltransferase involved in cell wall biosynthesis
MDSINLPLISIITPVYNCAPYIQETIDSICSQTYSNWELILVDDCSTDSSCEIIQENYLHDQRIQLIHNRVNEGAAVSRNNGITASKGRFICFLDSDDLWKPKKLEHQLTFQMDHSFAFTYTSYERLKDQVIVGTIPAKPQVDYYDLLKTCSVGCSTVMIDTDLTGKPQFPLIRKRQDYALWLKLLKTIDHAHGLPETLTTYRVRNDSISSNKFKAASFQWHVYYRVEKLSFIRSIYYLAHYTIHGILNRI